jgi:hypothetical protein
MDQLLYKNGIESIILGVEDMQSKDIQRIKLSAVRNLFAGILILIKALLDDKEKGCIYKVKKNPDGEKHTLDYFEIKRKCEDLKLEINFKPIDELHKFRNDLEHRYPKFTPTTLKPALEKCCSVLHNILTDCMGKEPVEELGHKAWNYLLKNVEIFQRESKKTTVFRNSIRCQEEVMKNALIYFHCPNCGSELIKGKDAQQNGIQCIGCGETISFSTYIELSLAEYADVLSENAYKDGGNSNLAKCPYCTYEVSEKRCNKLR